MRSSLAVRLTLGGDEAHADREHIEAAVKAVWAQFKAQVGARQAAWMTRGTFAATRIEDTMDFSVESLETPALTKAQLADLLFEQIG
jgi:hypothetical protein